MARTTMVAIEKGERAVRPEELVELARVYDRSLSQLLQRGQPAEGLAVQLRGAFPSSGPIAPELASAVDELASLCEDYRWLEEERAAPLRRRYPAPYEVAGLDAFQAAEDVAAAERRRLGLGDGPLSGLREVLESEVGLRIFLVRLPAAVAGMYAFSEALGGCVGLNRDHPPDRRRQTLAHEYGHFLTSRFRTEVLREGRYERVPHEERFAEAFGRSFLMPSEGLRRRFLDLQRQRRDGVSRGDLLRLAHAFAVSLEALVRRLEELGLAATGTWDRLRAEGLRVREAQRLLGLEPVADGEALPTRFIALAMEAWDAGDLSEGQLARLLRASRLELRSRIGTESADPSSGSTLALSAPLVALAPRRRAPRGARRRRATGSLRPAIG